MTIRKTPNNANRCLHMTENNNRPRIEQPPFSISHIFAWTLGTAFLLVFYRFNMGLYGEVEDSVRATLSGQYLAHCFLHGPSIACLGIFVVRKIRGGAPLPVEPGHWMLLHGAVYAISALSANWILSQLPNSGLEWLYLVLIHVPGLILLVFALAARRCFRLWRAYFALEILNVATSASLFFLVRIISVSQHGILSLATTALPLFVLIAATIDDQVKKVKRDWIHWVGVVTGIGSVLLSTLLSILFSFLF